VLRHLKSLGVTAVELMPVHHHAYDRQLVERGLTNYWGYNTLSFFAPDLRYATRPDPLEAVREFKMMVRALHAEGIEVILDVVYNHTAEGNHWAPRCPGGASTTPPIIGSCRKNATTWTTPGAATL
jgi:isoamylase